MAIFPDLSSLVDPQSVAIIGASPNRKKGPGRIAQHLLDGNFSGELYLVNPKYADIDGRPCYNSIADLPSAIDVAVVMIPADAVLETARVAASHGVLFLVVMSSGFSEFGSDGHVLQEDLAQLSRESGMRIYGPNCPGYLVMSQRRAISFSPRLAMDAWQPDARIALVTQGGAMGRAVIDAMESHGSPGLNYWFSTGNEADLQASDFLGWLADEPGTDAVLMVLESFRDGRRFMEAAERARDNGKPVVILKVGRSDAGRQATATHTAALAGPEATITAALRQTGVTRVDDIDELVDLARIIDRYGVRKVRNVGVCSLSGGSAAHLADLCGVYGLSVEPPSRATIEQMKAILPPLAAVGNPVDFTTGIFANPELVEESLKVFIDDPHIDAVVMPFPYQLGKINHIMADKLAEIAKHSDKPVITVGISEGMLEDPAADTVRRAKIPYVLSSTKAVMALKRYASIGSARATGGWQSQAGLGGGDRLAGRGTLSETASEQVLSDYKIAFARSEVADGEAAAIDSAGRIGYPVVMKATGEGLAHKSDAGLVKVGINDAGELARAYADICAAAQAFLGEPRSTVKVAEMVTEGVETLCGLTVDPSFGVVVSFGLGGIYAELLNDVAWRVCPVSHQDALEMIEETSAADILRGIRGGDKLDVAAVADTLVNLSRFGCEHADQVRGVDINPLKVGRQGAMGLDALVILSE